MHMHLIRQKHIYLPPDTRIPTDVPRPISTYSPINLAFSSSISIRCGISWLSLSQLPTRIVRSTHTHTERRRRSYLLELNRSPCLDNLSFRYHNCISSTTYLFCCVSLVYCSKLLRCLKYPCKSTGVEMSIYRTCSMMWNCCCYWSHSSVGIHHCADFLIFRIELLL